jgi:anti-sigma factor RsiW
MIQTLPHPTLLRYVYNELPAEEQHEVEDALLHDPELAAACADLLLAQRTLNGLVSEPSSRSTAAILQYSRTFLR